ncbi:MAG TPA: hypothetical protein VJB87_05675 [Candidatus Nanoarchaeia archaeon]|nr:hypothetical protein [Candidatus Nanoarchaeia archaeon]
MGFEEIYSNDVSPQTRLGYRQVWFAGSSANVNNTRWIKMLEQSIVYAVFAPIFDGLPVGDNVRDDSQSQFVQHHRLRSNPDLRWVLGPYITRVRLFEGSLVITNERKELVDAAQERVANNSFPKYIVTVESKTEDDLRHTAQKLYLPLEVLVNS